MMKTYLNTLYLVLTTMVSLNARSIAEPCLTTADSQMTLSEQVAYDLVQGIWTADLPSSKNEKARTIVQFRPAGLAEMMELQAVGNYLRKQFAWSVEEAEDQLHLLLYDLERNEQYSYDLVKTCQALELTEMTTGKRLILDYNARAGAREMKHLQETLVGEWANSLYPFELARNGNKPMPGAFLYYQFNADGSYSKSLGISEAQIDETGQWEVSADGQYLMMHTEEYQGGRKERKTTIARIKLVMFEEMVLEHSLRVSNESFCTESKDFFFSKI